MKRKVLVFTDWFLPGYRAGGPVTSLANMTARLGGVFEFYIVTRNTDYGSDKPYENIPPDEWTERDGHTRVYYFSQDKLGQKNLESIATETGADTWYINGVYSWYFSILPVRIARKRGVKNVVIAPRGMLSPHALGLKTLKKRLFILLAKLTAFYSGVVFHATNPDESRHISQFFSNRVETIPNLGRPISPESAKKVIKHSGELRMVSIARIAPEKNTLGALQILLEWSKSRESASREQRNRDSAVPVAENQQREAALHQHEVSVRFDLYGQVYQSAYWEKCLAVIDQLPSWISVEYCGTVSPDRLDEVLEDAHALFLPTTGENFGHAILEAFATGRPALISDRTPWQDLQQNQAGWDIPLDDEKGFQDALNTLLKMEQAQFNKLCSAARSIAIRENEQKSYLEAYERLLKNE